MHTDTTGTIHSQRSALHTAARILIFAAVVTQVFTIVYSWWNAYPGVSCNRLPYWGEWIDCLHGPSHAYVENTEIVIFIWIFAGVATLIGRYLPVYVSVLVPGLACAGFIALMVSAWSTAVMPYAVFGTPELWDVLLFAKSVGVLTIELVCPIIAGWLLGFQARRRRLVRSV